MIISVDGSILRRDVVGDIEVADDKRGVIVRGYEVEDQNTAVYFKFPLKIEKPNATDLIEDDLPEMVDASGGSVRFNAASSINAIQIFGSWAQ